jgi:polyphosphate kinase 2 (PPK2 family)
VSVLDRLDLTLSLPDKAYDKKLPALQYRLHELQVACLEREVGVVVMLEGWDAAGKGGAIRRLIPTLDPRAFEVVSIAAPKGDEADHHYLWRFWRYIPRAGHMTIFDRSWYGRVLVERVEGFSPPKVWRRAYAEIVEFERQLVDSGMVIVKYWLHISKEEQLRRFRDRSSEHIKRYKIGPEDWRNRKKWTQYELAVDEMVRRTNRPGARWTLVEAEDKRWARVRILETLVQTLEEGLKHPSPARRYRKFERRLRKLARV